MSTTKLMSASVSNGKQEQEQSQEEEEVNPWLVDEPAHNGDKAYKPVEGVDVFDPRRVDNGDDNSDSDEEDQDRDLIFQDMQMFFHSIGEPQLIPLFLANKVTLGQLLDFEESDLINCGVELVGDRKKILSSVAQMHCEKWMPSSLQDLTAKTLLSSPGMYIALNDINKHVEYIGVTFNYLRRCIQRKPEILELGKDYVGVPKVASELEDLLKTSEKMHVQLKALNRHISMQLNNPLLRPANHIDNQYLNKTGIRRRIAPILLAATAIGLVIVFKKALN